jgi:hypothetical protein
MLAKYDLFNRNANQTVDLDSANKFYIVRSV